MMHRLWNLTDTPLLAHFAQNYPQSQPWQLRTLWLPIFSALISALLRMRVAPQPVLNVPTPTITPGPSGSLSAPNTKSTPFLATVPDPIPYLHAFAQ
jgi:hypothetical protein